MADFASVDSGAAWDVDVASNVPLNSSFDAAGIHDNVQATDMPVIDRHIIS